MVGLLVGKEVPKIWWSSKGICDIMRVGTMLGVDSSCGSFVAIDESFGTVMCLDLLARD